MRLFLSCLFMMCSYLYAQTIAIALNDDFRYVKASPFMEYVADENSSLSIETIDSAQWKPMLSSNLGGLNDYPSWTKCTIKNTSDSVKALMIKNPRANMDEIDLYILRDNEITIRKLGDKYPIDAKNIPHRYSVELLELAPQEEVHIISKLVNMHDSTEGEWEIFSRKSFIEFTMLESLWWGVFIGIYIALFFYATPILIATKDKILSLFFSFYIISSIGYQFSVNGVLHSLGVYGHTINVLTLFFNVLFSIFTILVILRFLRITHHKGILWSTLHMILALLFLEIIIALVSFFEPSLLRSLSFMTLFLGMISFLIWILLLRYIVRTSKNSVFLYIFIGYTAVFIGHLYQTLITIGILQMHTFSTYSVSVASLFEMYFFALGISQYIKKIKQEKIKKEQLLDFQMRFASIGRLIGNISHQWKTPIIRAGALLTHIEALLHLKKDTSTLEEIESIIPEIRSHFSFMQNTIDEFYTLYSKNRHKASFQLSRAIHDVWQMLSTKVKDAQVVLHVNDPHAITLYSYESSFYHIMIILLDNALDTIRERAIENPHIIITISKENKMVYISVEDNCGGIRQKPIESIFEIEVSSKQGDNSAGGLGLSIVKHLVSEKFHGTIGVTNTQKGAKFDMRLPHITAKKG